MLCLWLVSGHSCQREFSFPINCFLHSPLSSITEETSTLQTEHGLAPSVCTGSPCPCAQIHPVHVHKLNPCMCTNSPCPCAQIHPVHVPTFAPSMCPASPSTCSGAAEGLEPSTAPQPPRLRSAETSPGSAPTLCCTTTAPQLQIMLWLTTDHLLSSTFLAEPVFFMVY